jgi:ribosomal RNA-processing protein 36
MDSDGSSASDERTDSGTSVIEKVNESDDESLNSGSDDEEDVASSSSQSTASSGSSREHSDYASEDDHVPVGVKLQRQREAGVNLRDSRQRKAHAKEVAFQRLNRLSADPGRETKNNNRRDDKKAPAAASKPKKSKNAPKEVSSRRSEFFKRLRRSNVNESGLGVTLAAGYKPVDPRLSNLTGHLDAEKFERNYAFLNDLRDKEIVRLKQRIRAHQTTGSKGRHMRRRLGMSQDATGATLDDDRDELKRLEREKADLERQQINRTAKRAVKKRMLEQVEQGGKPHFVSRAKQKQMVLEAKYDEIRKRKGDSAVEKAISKRLKKDKSKMLLPK